MFDLYTFGTPNGYKTTIALEELGLDYAVHPVNVREGAQFAPEIVAMNPNAKIPILVDRETGTTVYESGAILLYLATKTGQLFPSPGSPEYWEGLQLLFFAAASVGPMFGQRFHFAFLAEETIPNAIARYDTEGARLNAVLDKLLEGRDYFLASGYSIVDIMIYDWMFAALLVEESIVGHPNLQAWVARVEARPAVQKGLTIPFARERGQLPPRKTVATVG